MIRQPPTELYSSAPARYHMATVSSTPLRPAVSVSIITYNQRDLIGRAIDSVLAQRVNFDYEIIIGDDYSDDGTQDILREYQHHYPDRIQLILHPRRYRNEVPGRTNNTTNLLNCRGKYTAMLDGDDYWTDPDKLQRQYDRMEANPELSMCLHDARNVYEPGMKRRKYELKSSPFGNLRAGIYTHYDIAMRNRLNPFIGSLMFRTAYLRPLPDWFYDVVAADYALILYLSSKGKVYYDDRLDAAYYIKKQNFQDVYRWRVHIMERDLLDIDLYGHHFPATRKNVRNTRGKAVIYYRLYLHFRRRGQWTKALGHLRNMLQSDFFYGISLLFPFTRKVRYYWLDLWSNLSMRSAENSAAIRS